MYLPLGADTFIAPFYFFDLHIQHKYNLLFITDMPFLNWNKKESYFESPSLLFSFLFFFRDMHALPLHSRRKLLLPQFIILRKLTVHKILSSQFSIPGLEQLWKLADILWNCSGQWYVLMKNSGILTSNYQFWIAFPPKASKFITI